MPETGRLKEIGLFKGLSEEELQGIAGMLEEATYKAGEVIWEEGSPEQGLHIIESGKVRVIKRRGGDTKQTFAILKKGNFYGELSLLDGRSHSASVEAMEETRVLILHRTDLERLLKERPLTAYKIVRELAIEVCQLLRDMNYKFMNLANYIWEEL